MTRGMNHDDPPAAAEEEEEEEEAAEVDAVDALDEAVDGDD